MQVRGLPRQIIRNGAAASRLLAAKTPNIEAERRRDAAARWRRAMANGLTAGQAAQAVGVPRSTLYRWEKSPEPRSRRPRRVRQPKWPPALVEAVEAVRADNPMWGKRKIAALLKREGQAVSVSKVGRILRRLMARGVVVPVPILRRRPGARRFRFDGRQRYAQRLAKGRKARAPESWSRSTRSSSTSVPTGRSNTSPPTIRSPNGRSATSRPRHPPAPPGTCSTNCSPAPPSQSAVSRSTADPSSCQSSKTIAATSASNSSSCRPNGPTSTAASSAPSRAGGTNSTPPTTCPRGSTSSSRSSTLSPTGTTTTDLTRPLAISRQPSISGASAQRPRRLICAEPAQTIAFRPFAAYKEASPEFCLLRLRLLRASDRTRAAERS